MIQALHPYIDKSGHACARVDHETLGRFYVRPNQYDPPRVRGLYTADALLMNIEEAIRDPDLRHGRAR